MPFVCVWCVSVVRVRRWLLADGIHMRVLALVVRVASLASPILVGGSTTIFY